jgi:ribosomal protein L11 methyltransferase
MNWTQLSLHTSKNQADFVSEVLIGLGSLSITFSDAQDDAIFEPAVGETPLWPHVIITALFDLEVNQAHIQQKLGEICHISKTHFELLKNRVWEDECKKDFHSMRFGRRIWIRPSWESARNLPNDAIIINMDPGLAFGTGTHQTTDLCLQYLDANPCENFSVIDYGSGTGILAIAAAKLGATGVIAVDNDPQAVLATTNNILANQVENRVKVVHSDEEGKLEKVDLLMANILANPLISLCEHFADLLKSGGKIVLSGIFQAQLKLVLEAYSKYFDHLQTTQKEGWCRIDGTRK